jgi:hypothetical protein
LRGSCVDTWLFSSRFYFLDDWRLVRVRGAKNSRKIISCLAGAATPEPCGDSWHYTTVLGGISAAAVRHGGTASAATPEPCGRIWHYTVAVRQGEAACVAVLEKIIDYKYIPSGLV